MSLSHVVSLMQRQRWKSSLRGRMERLGLHRTPIMQTLSKQPILALTFQKESAGLKSVNTLENG